MVASTGTQLGAGNNKRKLFTGVVRFCLLGQALPFVFAYLHRPCLFSKASSLTDSRDVKSF